MAHLIYLAVDSSRLGRVLVLSASLSDKERISAAVRVKESSINIPVVHLLQSGVAMTRFSAWMARCGGRWRVWTVRERVR